MGWMISPLITTVNIPHMSLKTRPTVVWTSLGPLPRWVPGRLLGGPLGLPDLCYTVPDGVKRKDHGGEVLG
jgi:hypothetical protein